MAKFNLFAICVLSVLVMIFSGCESSSFPPEPGSPSTPTGKATSLYPGYAPPNDPYDNDMQIFFLSGNIFNTEDSSIPMGVKVSQKGGYIYKYFYINTNSGWKKMQFSNAAYKGSNWIEDSASLSLDINTNEISPGENYIIAYSCKKYNGAWRCGCESQGGPCNMWMLQSYLFRPIDIPPEPSGPDRLITTRLYLDPAGSVYTDGNVPIYGYLYGQIETLKQMQAGELMINIVNKNTGNVLQSSLKAIGGPSCEVSSNLCYANFYVDYTPDFVGDYGSANYSIIYTGPSPDWLSVTNGGFYVRGKESLKNELILQDIGNFALSKSNHVGWYSSNLMNIYYVRYTSNNGNYNDYVSVNVASWKIDLSSYQLINFDGYDVYVLKHSQTDGYMSGFYAWFSNGRTIQVFFGGSSTEFEDVVRAYINKFPPDGLCVAEGGSLGIYGTGNNNLCCVGLTNIPDSIFDGNSCIQTTMGWCTYCGDGICNLPENECNCPADCTMDLTCSNTKASLVDFSIEGISGNVTSGVRDFLKVGSAATYSIMGKDYHIGLVSIDSPNVATFSINGVKMICQPDQYNMKILQLDNDTRLIMENIMFTSGRDKLLISLTNQTGMSADYKLLQSETKTCSLGSLDYEVSVVMTDTNTTSAIFNVNGEITKLLKPTEEYILSDGASIMLKDLFKCGY